jgi:pimeloyl-ACP methyl ester carboxylesterase
MNNISSHTVDVMGLSTHYYESGKGEPLVIIHGGGEGAAAWLSNINELSNHYHVYAPNLPGFGLSAAALNSYAVPDVMEFVNAFSVCLELTSFNLVGHSFGGGIAAHLALKYPEKVRKLVLVSSLCVGKEIAWWVRMFSFGSMCRILGNSIIKFYKGLGFLACLFGDVVIQQPFTAASVAVGEVISNHIQQKTVLAAQLAGISMPTLVVWGEHDQIVPLEHAYRAGDLIPDCRVQVFADCGHSVYREDLGGFSKAVRGFLG